MTPTTKIICSLLAIAACIVVGLIVEAATNKKPRIFR